MPCNNFINIFQVVEAEVIGETRAVAATLALAMATATEAGQ